MPLIVDKDEVKKQILAAFEKCIEDKPISKITLRDIAAKAHMTHPKLLNYFNSKEDIIFAYCNYAKNYMVEHCRTWFTSHSPKDYPTKLDYMNAFMCYVATGGAGENRPSATLQTYVFAKYHPDIQEIVSKEFATWRETMKECLMEVYGDSVGEEEAEAMMILITGTFVCNYTGALTGQINENILSCFCSFAKKD